jgi:hypothetical protein
MKLAEYLQTQGISKIDFSKKVGRSRVTVFRWCELSRIPNLSGLIAVKEATDGAVGNFEDWVKENGECRM